MASLDFLLQGMQTQNHKQAIHELLDIDSPNEVLISVAFLRDNGFQLIKEKLSHIASGKVKFFIGIRNDITSMQGIYSLYKEGYTVYTIDTGASDFIYHPKIYIAQNSEKAKAIIGSSNLTQNGLIRNIEGSVLLDLDKGNADDQEFLNKTTTIINNLPSRFENNVTEITSVRQIVSLKNDGRLMDERISIRSQSHGVNTRNSINRESVPRMNTTIESIPRARSNTRAKQQRPRTVAITTSSLPADWILVWTSSPLTERYLNIPTGTNTHATGSMGMTKGETEGIDQRHYFRDEVFAELNWKVSPTTSNSLREIATANMYLTIKGINYTQQQFELTHDPRTNTKTYIQNNFVTGLRWGSAKPLVAQRDLLGSRINLFKRTIGTTVEYLMQFA